MNAGGGGLQQDMDDAVAQEGAFFLACIVLVLIVSGAFVYKVWNERQMTHEYHEQAVQQKRSADALEFFAEEVRAKAKR